MASANEIRALTARSLLERSQGQKRQDTRRLVDRSAMSSVQILSWDYRLSWVASSVDMVAISVPILSYYDCEDSWRHGAHL